MIRLLADQLKKIVSYCFWLQSRRYGIAAPFFD